jgi:hypothetical protein
VVNSFLFGNTFEDAELGDQKEQRREFMPYSEADNLSAMTS